MFWRGPALADRFQELVEDAIVPIEEDRLGFEPHRLLPQGLHRLPLLHDPSLEFRRGVPHTRRFRLRHGQVVREGLIEGRKVSPLQPVILRELDGRRVDRPTVLEDDDGASLLVDGHCEIVESGVESVHLGVAEFFHFRLFLDVGPQADFLGVRTAQVQNARQDPDYLTLGRAESICESASVELERVQSRLRESVRFGDLDRSVLERLRKEDRGDRVLLRDDDVPFAEYLEDEVDRFSSALEMEDRNPVEPVLLDSLDAGVVEEPPQSLRERRRGFRLVLDLVEAEPAPRLVEQFDLAARKCVDSEDDFVSLLVRLVDMTADELLPLRDESPQIAGGKGWLHFRRSADPGLT